MNIQSSLPPVSNEHYMDDRYQCDLLIDAKLQCFAGHFPGEPIVPGVVQVGWALHFASRLGLDSQHFAGVPRAKFSAIITPDTLLRLNLTRRQMDLDFRFDSTGQVYSSGTIHYAG